MSRKQKKPIIEFASLSDQGLRRPDNQDSCGIFPQDNPDISTPKGQLFIVADGMGGHARGSEASDMAVRTVEQVYFSDPDEDIVESLRRAFETANSTIYQHSDKVGEFRRMGTTCTALVLSLNGFYIAHVGDSKIYRINRHKIEQLTQDHTHVAEMRRYGILSEQEAQNNPQRSLLIRALGIEENVEIDIMKDQSVHTGDNYLLCTDGLASVSEQEINQIVLSNSPQRACEELVNLENKRGGNDNITVQVVRINSAEKTASYAIPKASKKLSNKSLTYGASIILLLAVGTSLFMFKHEISQSVEGLLDGWKAGTAIDNKSETAFVDLDSDSNQDLSTRLEKAKSLLRSGALDRALVIYEEILKNNPLHLDAIDGVSQLADAYKNQADTFVRQGRSQIALNYYQKAADLRPKDQELKRLISLIEKSALVATPANLSDQNEITLADNSEELIAKHLVPGDSIQYPKKEIEVGIQGSKWDFLGLSEKDYEIDNHRMAFSNSPRIKKVIYREDLMDVEVEVQVENFNTIGNGRFGVIVGYEKTGQLNLESYFLVSINNQGHLVLNKNFQYKRQLLLSEHLNMDSRGTEDKLNLKVTCLGPWILLYLDEKLVKAWEGNELIKGRVGLYADPDLQIKFSQFRISSAIAN